MALHVDPTEFPESFDRVIFAKRVITPGRCRVEGWSRKIDYDIKTGKGTKGATETLKGLPPAKGKITWWTWTPEQRRQWSNEVMPLLRFDPSKLANTSTASNSATKPTTDPTSQYTATQGGTGSGSGSSSGTIPQPGSTGKTDTDTSSSKKDDNSQPALSKDYAIEIYYPSLADIDVHFVLPPESLGAWEPEGDDFSYMKREIEFVEFVDADNSNIATTPSGAPNDPDNAPAAAGGQGGASNNGGGAGSAGQEAQGAGGAP